MDYLHTVDNRNLSVTEVVVENRCDRPNLANETQPAAGLIAHTPKGIAELWIHMQEEFTLLISSMRNGDRGLLTVDPKT